MDVFGVCEIMSHAAQTLADGEDGRRAAEALRSLISEIVLASGDKRGEVHAELRGELFGILEFANPEQNQSFDRIMTKGVAGPGSESRRRRAFWATCINGRVPRFFAGGI
ncbi:hypothetical protein ACWGS9_03645 [Bradyrhizobium sp. Arg314]